jgi:hypothetical protein
MKNSNDTIGNRIRDFQDCIAVPQPLRHWVPPMMQGTQDKIKGGFNYGAPQDKFELVCSVFRFG